MNTAIKSSSHEADVAAPRGHSRREPWFRRNRLWVLLTMAAVIGSLFYTAIPRKVGEPFEVPFAVSDQAFRDSLAAVLGSPIVEGNTVRTLVNGKEIFPAMLESIRGAKKSITLETYIWSSGRLSDQFIEALSERARQGVKVHALADGIGTINLDDREMELMKEAGVEFVLYDREHWYQPKPDINHRTHRKLLIVDGRVGYTGGVCIADEWLGDADSPDVWRDTQVRIEGPVVAQMQATFAVNWLQTTSRLLVGTDYFPHLEPVGSVAVQAVKSGPNEDPESARISHLIAIASARESILLSHAYFVPDSLAIEMLLAALRRGVRVDVIVPDKNDSRVGRAASRASWGRLLEAGAVFHRYEPAMYHQKSMIVDGVFVTVGSVNFDNRSFTINDEFNVNILDRSVAREHEALFASDRAESSPYSLEQHQTRGWWVKGFDRLCSMLQLQL